MVYRRPNRKTWTFQARTQTGWNQLGTLTSNKSLASRIEGMWNTLATEHRAWDVLGRVMAGTLPIGVLYDLWTETRHDLPEVRRRLNDTDLEPLVADWHAVHGRTVNADSAAHALVHVRALLPEGTRRLASEVTTAWLTEQLYAYPGKQNTLR